MGKILSQITEKCGGTSEEVEREISKAIKATWESPNEKELQQELFPNGKIPSNEQFIKKLAERIK